MGVKNFVQRSGVTDVGLAETVVRVVVSARQDAQISRVGEFIDVYHLIVEFNNACRTAWLPMNPAPPVISIFAGKDTKAMPS